MTPPSDNMLLMFIFVELHLANDLKALQVINLHPAERDKVLSEMRDKALATALAACKKYNP